MNGRRLKPHTIGHRTPKGAATLKDLDTTTSEDQDALARPVIGVVSQWRRGTSMLKVPVPYAHAVELAGGRAVVVSSFDPAPDEEAPEGLEIRAGFDPEDSSGIEDLHGLIVPGGGDVNPELYGAEAHPRTHSVSPRHDRYELTLLAEALRRDMPILAICRGMQLLNVCLGGTLIQHLADSPQLLDHDRDRPRADPAHKVRLKERSNLARVLEGSTVDVNSHHHQGLDRVGRGLEEIAWAEDGVLEAVAATERSWVLGVQWHPEAMAPIDARQLAIFVSLTEAATDYALRKAGRAVAEARSA